MIFEGTYSEFRKEGRSVKNENFRGEAKQKFLRSRFKPTSEVEGEEKSEANGEERKVRSAVGRPMRRENRKFEGKERRFERGSRSIFKGDEEKSGEKKFGRGSFGKKDDERRKPRRPKNGLEEGNQKPYSERRKEEAPREKVRSEIDGKEHSEGFTKKMVKFRQPSLPKESGMTVGGRRLRKKAEKDNNE